MKKVFAIVLLSVLCLSLFAGNVTFDTGISFVVGSRKTIDSKGNEVIGSVSMSETAIPLEVGYRETMKNGLIVGGSVGFSIPVAQSIDETTVDKDAMFPSMFVIKGVAGTTVKINKEMNLEVAGGISAAFGTESATSGPVLGTTTKVSTSYTTLAITGEALVSYKLNKQFNLRGGLKFAIPFGTSVSTKTTITTSSSSTSSDPVKKTLSGFMFGFTPFVGGSYQF